MQISRPLSFVIFSFAILAFLSINFFSQPQCDEISQINQWLSLCSIGRIVLVAIAFYIIIFKSQINQFVGIISWSIIIMGVAESLTALLQLYGLVQPNNDIYKETGTFYNPGPLGGYIAVCIPVAVYMWRNSERRCAKWLSLVSLTIMVMIEPSTMSRTGWISAIIGTSYVLVSQCTISRLAVNLKGNVRIIFIIIAFAMAILLGLGIWHINSNSAFGRLFLWKISFFAAMKSPIVGSTTFAEGYGNMQESYFANGGTEQEMFVAGSPDYAFNEYLHYSIEWGIPVMICIIFVIVMIFVSGHRQSRYGLCGGIIALSVFAFSSYPMHIPSFVALAIIMIIGCTITEGWGRYVLGVLIIALSVYLSTQQREFEANQKGMKRWENTEVFYRLRKYRQASKQFEQLYEQMNWNGRFLYEYGYCLHCNEEYAKSTEILNEAMTHSCDPMILNIIGENYQALCNYTEAEKYFRRSINRMPERIYPHYLLFLLYSDEHFNNEGKRNAEAAIILNHKWKVESKVTEEIKQRVACQ